MLVRRNRSEDACGRKKIAEIVSIIKNGGLVAPHGAPARIGNQGGRTDERLSRAPADMPDIHRNVADIYRRKVERLAEAISSPQDRAEAGKAMFTNQ